MHPRGVQRAEARKGGPLNLGFSFGNLKLAFLLSIRLTLSGLRMKGHWEAGQEKKETWIYFSSCSSANHKKEAVVKASFL